MKKVTKLLMVASLACAIGAQASPLYKKCIACHGAKGEKVALGKSLVIKDMTKSDFVAALKGYKDGSYGRTQKAMMKAQVMALSEAQMEELASFITSK